VASIKPNNLVSGGGKAGPSGGVVRFTAGKVAGTATTRTIILAAYHLTEYQLSGGPGWLDNDRFDIEGRAATPTGEEQLRAMLLYRCEHRGRQGVPEAVFQLSYYRPLRRKVGRLESVRYPI
jgi:hypothetical protein